MPKAGETIVIYGAGGHAKELADQLAMDGHGTACFVDDIHSPRFIGETPVVDFATACERHRAALWFVAIGQPEDRHRIVKRLSALSLRFGSFVSSRAHVLGSAKIGCGVQVFAGAVISASVNVGDHVLVNFSAIISHDGDLAPFATLCPGVSVAGHVDMGPGVFVGVGATIRNGSASDRLGIGASTLIGAGSTVIGSIGSGAVVAGSPARIFKVSACL